LTAALLPYAGFICITAQLAATLQAMSSFALPALGPVLLNVCWLGAAWWLAPHLSMDPRQQAFVLAGSILLAGLLQTGAQAWWLRRRGFRFDYHVAACREDLGQVARSLGPMLLGLGVVQLNTLMDSLLAWLLAAPAAQAGGIWWLAGALDYPLSTGAAAAIYYGERFYQLPVALVGTAVATTLFPLLSRRAAHRQPDAAAADLGRALGLVGFAALPMIVLLTLLAEPLVRLALEHGQFSADDARRTARMVAAYATGIWAYAALPVLVRGFYAWGDYRTPVQIAMRVAGLNLALNLVLVWPLAEVGLALSTAVAAALQCLLLSRALRRKLSADSNSAAASSPVVSSAAGGPRLAEFWPNLAAAACMAGIVVGLDGYLPSPAGKCPELGRLAGITGAAGSGFFLAARLLGSRELTILLDGCKPGRRQLQDPAREPRTEGPGERQN
jgi:putative peptidoglycan lipid II flippase